jgi:hypothetical protein
MFLAHSLSAIHTSPHRPLDDPSRTRLPHLPQALDKRQFLIFLATTEQKVLVAEGAEFRLNSKANVFDS